MLLTVKLLLGRRCRLQVSGQESVAALKQLVWQRLQVPVEQQHLLFHGQILADDKRLCDYSIGPNASINVIMRPLEEKADSAEVHRPQPLWHHLRQVLDKHFRPQDAEEVLQLLKQEHEERLQKVSLGHLEQLAHDLLMEEEQAESTGEVEPGATDSTSPHKEEEREAAEKEEGAKEEEADQ
ncbi:ubiquitin-like protein 4B [Erinaceus europaeus]|uniref:Ubiquitin-like protein 4B n=1 Tax=Erinaceus europaeus TaxID=9365 RepID=A0A1S3A519_ERIEU|nr:ubiquitin-like protein 4B [Erinaceus europaeus]